MAETDYLVDILILLAAAVIAVPLFRRLGLGSVLGYLAAGVLVGPWGLGFIDQVEEIRHLAEYGVIFLLFIIGVELKPARLWAMRRMVFGLGTAQVMLTGLALAGVALLLGLAPRTAVIVGFGLALSSTAFGLQILSERGEMASTHGQTAFSILLLQDLAVVPLLTLVSLLAAETTLMEGIEFAILEAALAIAFVMLAARYLLSPALRLVAASRTAEVFTATAVFAVLGTAWLMEQAGLSLALGAFLAGLMMADSHYRHQVIADIQPFRGILLGLFFIGVGMSIDFGLMGDRGLMIVGLVAGLLALKTGIVWVLCRLMDVSTPNAARVSLLLSQSGEFGFVLFGLAASGALLPGELFQILTLVVALTMLTTPLMVKLGDHLSQRLSRPIASQDVGAEGISSRRHHVLIAGFGRVGRRVAQILQAGNVPYVAIESDADRVHEGRKEGFAVYYGDASQAEVLRGAGAERAGALVCTLDSVIAAERLVRIMHEHFPKIPIHARGHNRQHCDQLLKAGASLAISETLEASLQIGAAVLEEMGVLEEEAAELIDSFRESYYS